MNIPPLPTEPEQIYTSELGCSPLVWVVVTKPGLGTFDYVLETVDNSVLSLECGVEVVYEDFHAWKTAMVGL